MTRSEKAETSPEPAVIMPKVLIALIIYHNCFRDYDHISWGWLAWIPAIYVVDFIIVSIIDMAFEIVSKNR